MPANDARIKELLASIDALNRTVAALSQRIGYAVKRIDASVERMNKIENDITKLYRACDPRNSSDDGR